MVLYIVDSVVFFLTLTFLLIANRHRGKLLSEDNFISLCYSPILIIHYISVFVAFTLIYNVPPKYFIAYIILVISAIRLILFILDCRIANFIIDDIKHVTNGCWGRGTFSLEKSPSHAKINETVKVYIGKFRHFDTYSIIASKYYLNDGWVKYITDREPFLSSGRMRLKNCILLTLQALCLQCEETFDFSVFQYCEERLCSYNERYLLQILVRAHDKTTYELKNVEYLFIHCLYWNWKKLAEFTNKAKFIRIKNELIKNTLSEQKKEEIEQYFTLLINTLSDN